MTWFGYHDGSIAATGTDDPTMGAIFGGGGVPILGSEFQTRSHRSVYRTNVWVNVAVNLRSRGIAKTPLKAYRTGRDGERERLISRGPGAHPLARLVARPWANGTTFRLLNALTLEYLVNDPAVGYVWMDRPSVTSPPTRLVPMRSDQTTARLRRDGSVGFYEWRETPGAEPERILPEYVMEIGFEDRVSPISALTRGLAIDEAAQTTTAAFYENGAQIGSVVTTDKALDDDTVESIEEQLRTDNRGPSNAFKTLVLANLPGAAFHRPGATSSDAQTIEHRKLAREETLAGYHVPQPVGGVLDRATFSNIETQTRMWVVDSLGEDYAMIESAFMGQLIARVKEWDDEGCYLEFDPGETLRGTPTQRAETYQKWLASGTYTPNELRDIENKPRIKHPMADALYVPLNLQPVGDDVEANGPSRGERVGTAAQRLGLGVNYGILSPDEARQIIEDDALDGPAPEPREAAPATVVDARSHANLDGA